MATPGHERRVAQALETIAMAQRDQAAVAVHEARRLRDRLADTATFECGQRRCPVCKPQTNER